MVQENSSDKEKVKPDKDNGKTLCRTNQQISALHNKNAFQKVLEVVSKVDKKDHYQIVAPED